MAVCICHLQAVEINIMQKLDAQHSSRADIIRAVCTRARVGEFLLQQRTRAHCAQNGHSKLYKMYLIKL